MLSTSIFIHLATHNAHAILNSGHPYEPLLAVSGIDHTIKIFSPDARAQDDAHAGVNLGVSATGFSGYSSLSSHRTRRRDNSNAEDQSVGDGLSSRKRMHQSYQIVSQNDLEREGGMRDAFITVRAHDGPFARVCGVEVGFAEWLGWFDG